VLDLKTSEIHAIGAMVVNGLMKRAIRSVLHENKHPTITKPMIIILNYVGMIPYFGHKFHLLLGLCP
jgi:hypothetical protein